MSDTQTRERDAEELIEELNALVVELEQYPDSEVRERALDLVQITLELYGEALRRITAALDALPLKDQILSRLLDDEIVRAVLLIHGLAPASLRERAAAALESLRPYLISQGCDVELTGVEEGRARVRLIRHGRGAPPVAVLKQEIEKALSDSLPDLAGVEIEGMAEQIEATAKAAALLGKLAAPPRTDDEAQPKPVNLVQIKRQPAAPPETAGPWVPVVRSIGFEEGRFTVVRHDDLDILVCKIGGEFYAYRNLCPAEGGRALDDAMFESPMLTCSCHGLRYDLRRGASVERPEIGLQSKPLKVEDDKVKVAL